VPLLYSSDSFADEIPVSPWIQLELHCLRSPTVPWGGRVAADTRCQFWLTSPLATPESDEGLLIVPSTLDTGDFRFNVPGQGWGTGADYLQYLKDTFAFMYEEGKDGMPRNMVITLHPRIVGHGSRAYYLEQWVARGVIGGSDGAAWNERARADRSDRFVKFLSEQPEVWVASRAQIAQHWRSNFPYEPAKAHDKVTIVKNVDPYKP
jgi:hypothetical protein